jgi:hypothetical protein
MFILNTVTMSSNVTNIIGLNLEFDQPTVGKFVIGLFHHNADFDISVMIERRPMSSKKLNAIILTHLTHLKIPTDKE